MKPLSRFPILALIAFAAGAPFTLTQAQAPQESTSASREPKEAPAAQLARDSKKANAAENKDAKAPSAQKELALPAPGAPAKGTAGAHPVWRGQNEQGKIIYSDSPKGLINARRIDLPEPALAPRPAPSPSAPRSSDFRSSDSSQPSNFARERAAEARQEEQLKFLRNNYEAAKALHEKSSEPLPGERLGTATPGRSRLTDDYFEHQRKLENAETSAKAAYEKALIDAK